MLHAAEVATVAEDEAEPGVVELGPHVGLLLLVAGDDADRVGGVVVEELAGTLGLKRLSFGGADRLMKYLGVIPGAVNPFGVINDHGGVVSLVLDRGLQEYELWNFHPLDNAKTTTIRREDMIRFLEAVEHPPRWIDF